MAALTAMSAPPTVLLLGGTGRTGGRVLRELVRRGLRVRAIVRDAWKLSAALLADPLVEVTEASLLALSDEALRAQVRGCAAVVSCLGHTLSFKGLFGPPRDLVAQATTRLCRAIEALQPDEPIKLILLTSVSVNAPGTADPRRGPVERAFLGLIRLLLPPARDNQAAADFLSRSIGPSHPRVAWVVVRPDTLLEGDAAPYAVHEALASSVFAPARTTMANIAHFMGELLTDANAWEAWKGRLPVIIDESR
jgi:nucleoside-diphosphate-sugar epimerase